MLNLCLVDEETRLLGIENHVCEIQLMLQGFLLVDQVRVVSCFKVSQADLPGLLH